MRKLRLEIDKLHVQTFVTDRNRTALKLEDRAFYTITPDNCPESVVRICRPTTTPQGGC